MTLRIANLVILLALLTLMPTAFAADQCTLATPTGDYGFSASGLLPELQKDGSIRYDASGTGRPCTI